MMSLISIIYFVVLNKLIPHDDDDDLFSLDLLSNNNHKCYYSFSSLENLLYITTTTLLFQLSLYHVASKKDGKDIDYYINTNSYLIFID